MCPINDSILSKFLKSKSLSNILKGNWVNQESRFKFSILWTKYYTTTGSFKTIVEKAGPKRHLSPTMTKLESDNSTQVELMFRHIYPINCIKCKLYKTKHRLLTSLTQITKRHLNHPAPCSELAPSPHCPGHSSHPTLVETSPAIPLPAPVQTAGCWSLVLASWRVSRQVSRSHKMGESCKLIEENLRASIFLPRINLFEITSDFHGG